MKWKLGLDVGVQGFKVFGNEWFPTSLMIDILNMRPLGNKIDLQFHWGYYMLRAFYNS